MLKQKQFSNSSHMLVEAGTAFILKVVEFYGEWKKAKIQTFAGKYISMFHRPEWNLKEKKIWCYFESRNEYYYWLENVS